MKQLTCNFLEQKGMKKNNDTMIYEFAKNSGIIVSCYEDWENSSEEKYEFTMNFLSEKSGDPQLIFCGLTQQVLFNRFDILYQLSYNLYSFLLTHQL